MAYVTQYTANFTNEVEQDVVCLIQKKDGASVSPVNLPVVSMRISDISDEQSVYACVIGKELELTMWADVNTSLSWETFIAGAHDDWKVTVTVDGETYFIGFVTPDEGGAPFQDKPYEISIKATDGIGLLKGVELTKIDGTKFVGIFKISDYIAAALSKTLLDLPIRAYCTYLNKETQNKYDSMTIDLFNTTYINHRTFLKDADIYLSCYDVLKYILGGWCNIQQYQGRWQIMCIADRQYTPNTLYYVDYSSAGSPTGGNFDTEGPAKVGRYELIYPSIYPINENQKISSRFANKQVKTNFIYQTPENLIYNQKLNFLGAEYPLLTGNVYEGANVVGTYKGYAANYWSTYIGQVYTQYQTPSQFNSYIRVEKTTKGNEIQRFLAVQVDPSSPNTILHTFAKNDNSDFFVEMGDFISISVTFRTLYAETDDVYIRMATLAILKDGAGGGGTSDWYSLKAKSTTVDSSGSINLTYSNSSSFEWINAPGGTFCVFDTTTEDSSQWKTISVDNIKVPASGVIYLHLGTGSLGAGNEAHFKDIRTDYKCEYKGESHLNKQSLNFLDSYENEVKTSNSSRRIFKGTFFRDSSGSKLLMSPEFYRFPATSETKNFKQLVNYGYFNHTYRRMYKIEGEFTSLMYNLSDNQEVRKPIGFHKLYRFADMSPQRDFVLIPSLEMDLVTGNIKATFVEAVGQSGDGTTTGDVDKFDYIF